jgi:hypothetical protein
LFGLFEVCFSQHNRMVSGRHCQSRVLSPDWVHPSGPLLCDQTNGDYGPIASTNFAPAVQT